MRRRQFNLQIERKKEVSGRVSSKLEIQLSQKLAYREKTRSRKSEKVVPQTRTSTEGGEGGVTDSALVDGRDSDAY